MRVISRKWVRARGQTRSPASSLSTRLGCAIRRSAQSSRTRGAGSTASITLTALSYWSLRTHPFRPDLRSVSDAPSGSPARSERSNRWSQAVEGEVVSAAVTLARQSARYVRPPLRSSRGSSRNTRARGPDPVHRTRSPDRGDLFFQEKALRELLVIHFRRRDVREAVERAAPFGALQPEVLEALQHH